jgi:hypothetical protein
MGDVAPGPPGSSDQRLVRSLAVRRFARHLEAARRDLRRSRDPDR